jgi:hypothetical protein
MNTNDKKFKIKLTQSCMVLVHFLFLGNPTLLVLQFFPNEKGKFPGKTF